MIGGVDDDGRRHADPDDLEEDLVVEDERPEHGGHDQRGGGDDLGGGGQAVGDGGRVVAGA